MLDVVIQRLFAAGLTVQSVAVSLDGDDERARTLSGVVTGIDTAIAEVRRHMTEDGQPSQSSGPPEASGAPEAAPTDTGAP